MKVTAAIEFEVGPVRPSIRKQFNQPESTLEVIDSDGMRVAFVASHDDGLQVITDVLHEAGFFTFEFLD